MNESVRAIIESITRRFDKPQVVAGHHLMKEYFETSQLTPNDVARLAAQAMGSLEAKGFDAVLGIAYTGILFAHAIAGGRQVNIFQVDRQIFGPPLAGRKVLIVDDVISTGGSIQVAHNKAEAAGATVIGYACMVDRTTGMIGRGSVPIWSAAQIPLEAT